MLSIPRRRGGAALSARLLLFAACGYQGAPSTGGATWDGRDRIKFVLSVEATIQLLSTQSIREVSIPVARYSGQFALRLPPAWPGVYTARPTPGVTRAA